MSEKLESRLREIAKDSGAEGFGVAWRECEGERTFELEADRMFHAASAIKLGVLWAVYRGVEEKRFALDDRLHVRNRFISVADGSPYSMDASRDGDSEVHRRIGRTMPVAELAKWMIITSSNLATNLLLDFVGLDYAREQLARFKGVELRRGVEDHAAFDRGISNEASAAGLAELLMAIHKGDGIGAAGQEGMLEILHQQKFNDMIPAGVPDTARVAHKTGEISSVCHDAGIVFPKDAAPYVLVILTQSSSAASTRREAVASMAKEIHQKFLEGGEG